MPRFSAFTPCPQLRFSSRKPSAQLIFEDAVSNLGAGENYTTEFNSIAMGRLYAQAMGYGRALNTLVRAGHQFRPTRAVEQLPALEYEVSRVPQSGESIAERQRQVAALFKIARGAKRSNVDVVMRETLGEDYVKYLTTSIANAVHSPEDPTDTGAYPAPGAAKGWFKTTTSVLSLGVPFTVGVSKLLGSDIVVGDVLVIDQEDNGRREAVVVTARTSTTLTATFTKPHNTGVSVVKGRSPNQLSSKRHNVFVLTNAACLTPVTRAKADRAAHELLRAPSTWTLTDGSGPFKVGVGRIGITTIGAVE